MKILQELLQLKEEAEENVVDSILKAVRDIASAGGARFHEVLEVEDDVVAFAIEFDFPEGLVKGSEIKKASKFIKRVGVDKGEDWGQVNGVNYEIELKAPLSTEDAKKLESALQKLAK